MIVPNGATVRNKRTRNLHVYRIGRNKELEQQRSSVAHTAAKVKAKKPKAKATTDIEYIKKRNV